MLWLKYGRYFRNLVLLSYYNSIKLWAFIDNLKFSGWLQTFERQCASQMYETCYFTLLFGFTSLITTAVRSFYPQSKSTGGRWHIRVISNILILYSLIPFVCTISYTALNRSPAALHCGFSTCIVWVYLLLSLYYPVLYCRHNMQWGMYITWPHICTPAELSVNGGDDGEEEKPLSFSPPFYF